MNDEFSGQLTNGSLQALSLLLQSPVLTRAFPKGQESLIFAARLIAALHELQSFTREPAEEIGAQGIEQPEPSEPSEAGGS